MTEHETPGPGDARPESLIRTADSVFHHPRGDEPHRDDEDLDLRVDTGEWQEYPSPAADPADPDSVAERMTGPRTARNARREADAGANQRPTGDQASAGGNRS